MRHKVMTPEEAKAFYFQYLGSAFHMGREEPAKYQAFRMLDVGKEILREWDEEMLEELFAGLWNDPERIWVSHGNILQVIRRENCDAGKYLNRLLDEMEKMEGLGTGVLTLIIENMAGRTESMKDGGAELMCRHLSDPERMHAVTERLISICNGAETDSRFREAVQRYRNAYQKFAEELH